VGDVEVGVEVDVKLGETRGAEEGVIVRLIVAGKEVMGVLLLGAMVTGLGEGKSVVGKAEPLTTEGDVEVGEAVNIELGGNVGGKVELGDEKEGVMVALTMIGEEEVG
jgi:hypothetical protein